MFWGASVAKNGFLLKAPEKEGRGLEEVAFSMPFFSRRFAQMCIV